MDGELIRCRIKVSPAIRNPAVVTHLEGDIGVAIAVGICGRREHQQTKIANGDLCRHRATVIAERTSATKRGNFHRHQAVAIRVAKAEVSTGEHLTAVFKHAESCIAATRCLINVEYGHRQVCTGRVAIFVQDGVGEYLIGVGSDRYRGYIAPGTGGEAETQLAAHSGCDVAQ